MEKKITEISWKVNEKTYRASPAYSYSTLSRFNREGFACLKKLYDPISSPYMNFGSAVDTLVTDSYEEFEKSFYVATDFKVVDSHKPVIDYLYNHFRTFYTCYTDIPDAVKLEAMDFHKLLMTRKPDTRIIALDKDGETYYNHLIKSEEKTIISKEDYQDAKDCLHTLKTASNTAKMFQDNNELETIQRYYQLKFKGTYNGLNLRCMADLIIVDYKNKIVMPVDLKTSSKNEWDFPESFLHWNYYIQAQLYWYLIRQNMDNDPYFKDFKLTNYRFVVINRRNKIPLVWDYPDTQATEDVTYGKFEKVYKNWRAIVTDLYEYETKKPKVPLGIFTKESNNLLEWLNKDVITKNK